MKNKLLVTILIIFVLKIFCLPVFAQSDQQEYLDWLKQRQEGQNKQAEEFKSFLSKRDQEFSGFLKQRWKEFEAHSGIKLFEGKKPVRLPVVKPKDAPIKKPKEVIVPEVKIAPEKPLVVEPSVPPAPKTEFTHTVTYFGQTLNLKLPVSVKQLNFKTGLSENVFADNWVLMSSELDPKFIQSLSGLKEYMVLNDWAFAILVDQISRSLYSGNNAVMLSWFILNKAGLKTKIGYRDRAYLLINPNVVIYGMSYYTLGDKKEKYYIISDFKNPYTKKVSKIKTYKKDYPDRQRSYELNMVNMPNFNNTNPVERTVNIAFKSKKYKFSYTLNKDILSLMRTIPQSAFSVYYSSGVSRSMLDTLVDSLKKIVNPMPEVEKINFLLRFSQKASKYQTDTDQFGKEVYMFPDQVLYFTKSDCDDRVSLLSYLVRKLMKRDMIFLLYPNHIATAVNLNQSVKGDFITYKNKRYYIADPTYIGADVGMTMPSLKNEKPKIFTVN